MPSNLISRLANRLRRDRLRFLANRRVWQLTRQVMQYAIRNTQYATRNTQHLQPIAFFNASTRLTGISQNAAFSLLAALGLELAGVPVVSFACKAGMSRCVLGVIHTSTNRNDPTAAPPCKACIAQSHSLFAHAPTIMFTYASDPILAAALQGLDIERLSAFEYAIRNPALSVAEGTQYATRNPALSVAEGTHHESRITPHSSLITPPIPLGPLVLPSLRWALRRHHLNDDDATRFLFREYIQSAYHVAREFDAFLEMVRPRAVVVFNGQFFPEATARWVARQRGVRVVTHEVGFQRFSAFFTGGEATAYPIDIPADFELTPEQDARLDTYLEQRFQGQFTMAGIRFWPEMRGLDEDFLQKAAQFSQIVPVFTNVIFDTSQPHSNTVFPHMFAWLDLILDVARAHPETLFVIRAHPDEHRPGKASRESVADWVTANRVTELPNVIFINSHEFLSSYELIQRSKFVMVYNSSIGLEASLMGAAVLCGGRARYTQYPTVFFPESPEAYRQQADEFLRAPTSILPPPEFQRNARRFLYYQLYRTSLPFDEFLEDDGIWPGFVRLRNFPWQKLTPEQSPAIRAIVGGIVEGKPFLV